MFSIGLNNNDYIFCYGGYVAVILWSIKQVNNYIKWNVHINPAKEKEETSMDFAPENQVWAVVPCSGVDGKKDESA